MSIIALQFVIKRVFKAGSRQPDVEYLKDFNILVRRETLNDQSLSQKDG